MWGVSPNLSDTKIRNVTRVLKDYDGGLIRPQRGKMQKRTILFIFSTREQSTTDVGLARFRTQRRCGLSEPPALVFQTWVTLLILVSLKMGLTPHIVMCPFSREDNVGRRDG